MAVLRRLFATPGLSRTDLSVALELTRSTVTNVVRELLEEGWLVQGGMLARPDPGRRPTPLFIDPSRLLLLGAEVGVGAVRVLGVSLQGEVLTRATARFDDAGGPVACVQALSSALLEACAPLVDAGRRVVGIGVGLPGGVDQARGFLRFAPNLGWRNVPFGDWLRRQLSASRLQDIPLFVRNEADVAAVGEVEFNASERASPLLYLSINRGLGAGLVVRDKLFTGARGFAGEVGHVVLDVGGPACSCGRRGCAEALIGAKVSAGGRQEMKDAGRYLGILMQNLAAIYDPGCMVLGGELVSLGEAFIGPALATLRAYAQAAQLPPVPVRLSRFGQDAVALGAAAFARYCLTRPHATAHALVRSEQAPAYVPLHRFRRLTPPPGPEPVGESPRPRAGRHVANL